MVKVEVLYIDKDILAVNKPAGMPTIRDGYDPTRLNLHQELMNEFDRLWVVHRLDVDTSGVILFARHSAAHRHLSLQFQHHTVHKTYHLLTFGEINWQRLEVDLPLRIDGDRRHRTIIDKKDGKPAITIFHLLDRFRANISLLSAFPQTGYTHQIRAHSAAQGLWLLADPLYFPRPYPPSLPAKSVHRKELFEGIADLPISRTSLHALSIKFDHPTTDQSLTISAKYPEDFEATIECISVKK